MNGALSHLNPDGISWLFRLSLAPAAYFLHTVSMLYRLGADFIVVLHIGFVLFVALGGFLVLKWPRLAWLHLPAVAWGAFVEFSGWICPLTPLENWLRARTGETEYAGDFIAQYLSTILYPESLTREVQIVLGTLVLAVNLAVYGRLWWAHCKRRG